MVAEVQRNITLLAGESEKATVSLQLRYFSRSAHYDMRRLIGTCGDDNPTRL